MSLISPIENVNISWNKMPKKLMDALKKRSIPKPSLRREMVRIVVEDIFESTSTPNRKICREVARKIAETHPESFVDKLNGQVLSNGYESLTNQLTNRCENVRRNSMKRSKSLPESDNDSPSKNFPCKIKIVDSYGCVNWNPILEEDIELLAKKKNILKQTDMNDLHSLKLQIKETYSLQRFEINQGSKISDLLEDWPILFSDIGIHLHFQLLTSINLEEKLASSLQARSLDYWNFFKMSQNKKLKTLIRTIEAKKEDIKFNEVIALLQAVATYFDEDISDFILTSEVSEVF